MTDENNSIELPANAEIIRAVYGLIIEKKEVCTMDITAKLAGLVKDGRLSALVENQLAGRDPVPMTQKELRVEYRLDGVTKHAVANEKANTHASYQR